MKPSSLLIGRETEQPSRRKFLREFSAGAASMAGAGLISRPAAASRERRRRPERSEIKRLVAREARNLGIPVSLALAVAHAESNFDPRAESHAGARGVMQIMPATGRGEYGVSPDMLWDARLNARIGLHFLGRLITRYKGRVDLALSYYNGGSAVGAWPNARVIPATRGYVRRVRKLEAKYRREFWRLGRNGWTVSRRNN